MLTRKYRYFCHQVPTNNPDTLKLNRIATKLLEQEGHYHPESTPEDKKGWGLRTKPVARTRCIWVPPLVGTAQSVSRETHFSLGRIGVGDNLESFPWQTGRRRRHEMNERHIIKPNPI